MNRVSSLLIAAVLALGLAGANFARSETSPPAESKFVTEKSDLTKEQRKAERRKLRQEWRETRRKLRAEERAARQAKLPACRDEAKQKSLRPIARRVYIYQCVRR
jgi:uncharacterized membrane protein